MLAVEQIKNRASSASSRLTSENSNSWAVQSWKSLASNYSQAKWRFGNVCVWAKDAGSDGSASAFVPRLSLASLSSPPASLCSLIHIRQQYEPAHRSTHNA